MNLECLGSSGDDITSTSHIMILRHATIQRRTFAVLQRHRDAHSHLPRVASPEIWRSIVPKFLRRRRSDDETSTHQSESQPGIGLVVLGLVAGSFAINIISLRREIVNFTRETEARLALLREVIGSVKRGEDVDVKRLLGTGDPQAEAEWEKVVEELGSYDSRAAKRRRDGIADKRRVTPWGSTKEDEAASDSKDEERDTPKFMM